MLGMSDGSVKLQHGRGRSHDPSAERIWRPVRDGEYIRWYNMAWVDIVQKTNVTSLLDRRRAGFRPLVVVAFVIWMVQAAGPFSIPI